MRCSPRQDIVGYSSLQQTIKQVVHMIETWDAKPDPNIVGYGSLRQTIKHVALIIKTWDAKP